MTEKQKHREKTISVKNVLGAVGAISGLLAGFFMLYYQKVHLYRPNEGWDALAFIMFFISLIAWISYIIYSVLHYYIKK